MTGYISSIKLNYNIEIPYWVLTIVDDNGNVIGTFGHSTMVSYENFRMQTFGIMQVLDNWNLFNLTNDKIDFVCFTIMHGSRTLGIINEDGHYLYIDPETAELSIGYDYGHVYKDLERRRIDGLISSSGTLSITTNDNVSGDQCGYVGTSLIAPHAYYNFKPLGCYSRTEFDSAKYFSDFVTQVMKIGKISDLIKQGKGINPNLKVSIVVNDGCITEISDPNREYVLTSDVKGYMLSENKKSNKKS